jgi:N-acetylglucosamine-6-phosphate deacetylase
MIYAFVNGRYITSEGLVVDKALLFDARIIGFVEVDEIPDEAETFDVGGRYVSAGFIDIHIHGSGGADVMDATPEALSTVCRQLPSTGTTTFLATTMSMSYDRIEAALRNVRDFEGIEGGAHIAGVHLEGPFINPKRAGAQDAAHIADPDISLIEAYADVIKMITVAPEVEGGEAFLRRMRRDFAHIVVSLGHSDATYEEAETAFKLGAKHVTHLFNAMRSYHHREPGAVGACFDSDATCDIIADGIHLHPHHLRLTYRMKPHRWILITDAMRAGCLQAGTYDLGGQRVTVKEGAARLEDGTLAGSVLKMNEALRYMCEATGCGVSEAVAAVTRRPAALLGLKNKGDIKTGFDADFVVFDEDFTIRRTYIGGKAVYG